MSPVWWLSCVQVLAMLKPGEASGSAFLKVDPVYLQHWQQLFPQTHVKAGVLSHVPLPEPSTDNLRLRPASLSSTSSTSSTPTSAPSAPSSLAGITPIPTVIGPTSSLELPGPPRKDLVLPSCQERASSRIQCTPEELDYYLYGQQRMEIIPLSNPTSDPNNSKYPCKKYTEPRTPTALCRAMVVGRGGWQCHLGGRRAPDYMVSPHTENHKKSHQYSSSHIHQQPYRCMLLSL